MKVAELTTRILAGELFLVGEYRNGCAVANATVDRRTGLRRARILIHYIVESAFGGVLRIVKITAPAPEDIQTPEEISIPLVRGSRYAFPVQSITREQDLVSAWLGRAEPLLIEAD